MRWPSLEQVLPRRLRRRVEALQTVSVQLRDTGPTVDAEVLAALASACRDGGCCASVTAAATGR